MIDIDELRRLRAAGTQGAWTTGEGLLKNEAGLYVGPQRVMVGALAVKGRDYAVASTGPVSSPDSHADAALICAAVNSLPALLDELARTRAQLDEARARLAMATNYETRDAITINRTAGGFSVSRWNPYTRDSEYLSSDGARWVVLDEDDELPPFPTADAAFAALAAARKE